jgi:hypothetical protein
VDRQRGCWTEVAGFSFAIAEASTDRAVGGIGLWLSALPSISITCPAVLVRLGTHLRPTGTMSH